MSDNLPKWKRVLRFDSIFHLDMLFLYMATSLSGRRYATYSLVILALWLVHAAVRRHTRRLLLDTVRGQYRVLAIGGLVLLYGVLNYASTTLNGGKAAAWDGWERVAGWIFCALAGVWLAGIHPPERIYRRFCRWQAAMLLMLSGILVGAAIDWVPFVRLGVLDFKTKIDTILEMLVLSAYVNFLAGTTLPKQDRLLQGIALVAGVAGIAAAGTSRLLLPVMAMGILLAAWVGRNRSLALAPAVLALLGLAAFATRPEIVRALAGIQLTDPLYWRLKILNHRDILWQLSLVMFAAQPWWGIGPGNFARVSEATRQAIGLVDPSRQQYIHAHNIWWNPFVACGIFAGLTHTLLMIYILGLTLARLEGERTRPLALNLLMVWLVYQFYGLVELAPTMEEIIPYVWGGTGLLAGTATAPDHS